MGTRNTQPGKRQTNISTGGQGLRKSATSISSDSKLVDKNRQRRRNTWIVAISISVVISLIIGIAYYLIYVMPFQRVIIRVDDDVIRVNYLLKRALNSSTDEPLGIGMLSLLSYELIVMQEAPNNGIIVTEQDIDKYLYDMAKGDGENITDAEYQEWYRQILNNTSYTDKELRNLTKVTLYQQRMYQLIGDNLPPVAEHWRLSVIIVKTYEEAQSVQERIANGEEFASLAREVSLDTVSKENGGDIGWFPRDYLNTNIQFLLAQLNIGECSDPINNNPGTETDTESQSFAVYTISEKDMTREIQPEYLDTLKSNAYQNWLDEQERNKNVEYLGIYGGGYDSATQAWLYYQLQRLEKGRTSTTE